MIFEMNRKWKHNIILSDESPDLIQLSEEDDSEEPKDDEPKLEEPKEEEILALESKSTIPTNSKRIAYSEINNSDLSLTFYLTWDFLITIEKCIRNKPPIQTFEKYAGELKRIMVTILSANSEFRRKFYRIMEGNASMDYRRTLRKASEVISTMRELMGEEELALMDSKAKGYVRLMERSIDEPFDKFIIDRINGFSFK